MVVSGFTLVLYCDCEECQTSYMQAHDEFVSDAPNCRARCFREARRAGWKITRDYKCYAPGHKKPRKTS